MAIKPLEDNNEQIVEATRKLKSSTENISAQGRASLLTNIMVIILFVFSAVLSFGDLSFSFKSAIDFSIVTLFIYTVTTVVHHTKYDEGVMRGKKTKEYKEASARYEEKVKEVHDKGLATMLPELCNKYVKEELETYRKSIIATTYLSWEDYMDRWCKASDEVVNSSDEMNKQTKEAVIRANHAKPKILTADQLLTKDATAKRTSTVLGVSPTQKTRFDKSLNSLTRVFTTILGCVMVVSFAAHPSLETFGLWCARMAPIVMAWLIGANAGFTTSAIAAPIYYDGKVEILTLMLEWERNGELDKIKKEREDSLEGVDLEELINKERQHDSTRSD
ncbi:MAG: hypothetical protein MJ236_01180 [Clostridia bacterium]|nr:hypothetical protein [Clostridia bacterium]